MLPTNSLILTVASIYSRLGSEGKLGGICFALREPCTHVDSVDGRIETTAPLPPPPPPSSLAAPLLRIATLQFVNACGFFLTL